LRLEEHLGGCDTCRARANLLNGLTRLAAHQPVRLDASARTRAITAALASDAARTRLSLQPPRRGFVLLGAATALVALAIAVQRALSPAPAPEPVAALPTPAFDRVLSGQVDQHAAGERLSESAELYTSKGASLALAHAQVELRADSGARWDARSRTLALQHGSAMLEVDPAKHQSFRVETAKFVVAVLGTRFEVTETAVHVLRGRVSVTPRAGEPIVLTANTPQADFELRPTAAAQEPPVAPTPQPRAAKTNSAAEARNASALLDRARSELAARDVAQARNTLELVAPQLHNSELRAQALSLEAECNMLERRFSAARDKYLQVARRFPQLPAAETALFAAARIEAEHGEATRAQALLTRYLERYPSGSFAREAQHRMQLVREAAPAEPEL
jgi:ferric-dicitrate binding protein FerR (iron transport regulator)